MYLFSGGGTTAPIKPPKGTFQSRTEWHNDWFESLVGRKFHKTEEENEIIAVS